MELRFANPQSAKVAMVKERGSSMARCGPMHGEGYEFVEHHARAKQIANGATIVPGNSDDPCDRGKQSAKDLLEARGNQAIPR